MPRAIIVCGGDFSPDLLPERKAEDLLVAADSGYASLKACGVLPDLCIGDFDSLGYVPQGETTQVLPVRKDDTDLMAAVRLGLERGFRKFVLLGSLGGKRFSHSLAAVQTLGFLAEHGADGEIRDANCTVRALRNASIRFDSDRAGHLSVFALSGPIRLTLRGLDYPLTNATLTPSFPLGVSNAFIGCEAEVTVEGGTALLVEEPE